MPSSFYVTFCLMGPASGANIFGHCCLILSQQKKENDPQEVTHLFGFYSQPSTVRPEKEPVWYYIKKLLGIKYDLQGGHGVLKKEVIREFDGDGLQGQTFTISEDTFERLTTRLQNEMREEQAAMADLEQTLASESNTQTRYVLEKEIAQRNKREERLRPFHFNLPADDTTYTCKTHALSILREEQIIIQSEFEALNGGWLASLPYYSGSPLLNIRFVAIKDKVRYVSSSGKPYYNPEGPLYFVAEGSNSSYLAIVKTLDIANKFEQKALRLNTDNEYKTDIINRAKEIRSMFSNKTENDDTVHIESNIRQAKKKIYSIMQALHPESVNYFSYRACQNASAPHVSYGLLMMGALALSGIATTAVGAVFFMAAVLYVMYNLYSFYQEEMDFQDIKQCHMALTVLHQP